MMLVTTDINLQLNKQILKKKGYYNLQIVKDYTRDEKQVHDQNWFSSLGSSF